MNLIQSYSVLAKIIRCVSVLVVAAVICTVFLISYDFPFEFWLALVLASLVSALFNYGFAIIIDAAYIYIAKNVPQEGIISEDSTAEENDSLYDDIINNG